MRKINKGDYNHDKRRIKRKFCKGNRRKHV